MSEDGAPRGGDGDGAERGDGDGEVNRDADTPRERAKRLAVQLRVLRMREQSANFENLEGIRREIRRKEEELTRLAATHDLDPDVDVRRE